MICCGLPLFPTVLLRYQWALVNYVPLLQLSTVVPWTPPPMEQWTHLLEPLTSEELTTPVTLDTLWLVEKGLEHVKLMECGALVNLPVNVSVTYTASILLIAPLQSLSCPLEALSTLTTQLCPSPSLERAPLPSPVTLSYPPAAGNKTTSMEGLSEGGEDQMGSVYLQRLLLELPLRDSTLPEASALSAWIAVAVKRMQEVSTAALFPELVVSLKHCVWTCRVSWYKIIVFMFTLTVQTLRVVYN